MTESVTIRAVDLPPSADDRAFLEHGMGALNDHELTMEPNRLPGAEMEGEHVQALMDEALARGGGALIAEDEDGPCGFVIYLVGTEFGRFVLPENQRFGILSDIWIDPRARRLGVGRTLIAGCEDALRALGMRRIEISAVWANGPARALYEECGYQASVVTLARQVE